MKTYTLDGARMGSFEGFRDEVARKLFPAHGWGGNLDALDDMLGGGFDTPKEGFILEWRASDAARRGLGYPETIRLLEARLSHCHPTNRSHIQRRIREACRGIGPTLFDEILEILRDHGPDGTRGHGAIRLKLR